MEQQERQEQVVQRFMECWGMLFGYVYAIVSDFHATEDILQDVLLVVMRKSEQLTDIEGFAPWARQIARFEALNAVKKIKRQKTKKISSEVMDLLEETWQQDDAHPETTRIAALRDCLTHLAPKARQIIQHRYFDGLTGQDLADAMGLKLTSANASLTKTHRKLETCVNGKLLQGEPA